MTLTVQGIITFESSSVGLRSRMMIVTWTVRVIVPTFALVVACGAGLVFGVTRVRHERSAPAEVMTAAPTGSLRSPDVENRVVAGLAQAQAEATAVIGALAVPPSSSADDIPAFDIARIGPAGDAVIAGRARPGATVELLLDGTVYDQAIADQSGQFVMTPPRLSPGDHDLTLRSGQREGKQVTSKQSVALHRSPSDPSQAYQLSSATTQIAEPRKFAALEDQQATAAATPLFGRRPHSVIAAAKRATTVVAGGDSLWRISLAKFGKGEQYSLIYDANRNQIRNPDRIFPGQRLVIPGQAH
jgi:nucleoid-associated protein YgaU